MLRVLIDYLSVVVFVVFVVIISNVVCVRVLSAYSISRVGYTACTSVTSAVTFTNNVTFPDTVSFANNLTFPDTVSFTNVVAFLNTGTNKNTEAFPYTGTFANTETFLGTISFDNAVTFPDTGTITNTETLETVSFENAVSSPDTTTFENVVVTCSDTDTITNTETFLDTVSFKKAVPFPETETITNKDTFPDSVSFENAVTFPDTGTIANTETFLDSVSFEYDVTFPDTGTFANTVKFSDIETFNSYGVLKGRATFTIYLISVTFNKSTMYRGRASHCLVVVSVFQRARESYFILYYALFSPLFSCTDLFKCFEFDNGLMRLEAPADINNFVRLTINLKCTMLIFNLFDNLLRRLLISINETYNEASVCEIADQLKTRVNVRCGELLVAVCDHVVETCDAGFFNVGALKARSALNSSLDRNLFGAERHFSGPYGFYGFPLVLSSKICLLPVILYCYYSNFIINYSIVIITIIIINNVIPIVFTFLNTSVILMPFYPIRGFCNLSLLLILIFMKNEGVLFRDGLYGKRNLIILTRF